MRRAYGALIALAALAVGQRRIFNRQRLAVGQLAVAVAAENPRWEFASGSVERPTHYAARLAVLSCMIPIGAATVSPKFNCGLPDCVDCTRTPSNRR